MTRYLIKCTYLTGPHKGEVYFLTKGGYVTGEKDNQTEDTTYKSYKIAENVCKKLISRNKVNYDDERIMNKLSIKQGFKGEKYFLYEIESYEPFAVEV